MNGNSRGAFFFFISAIFHSDFNDFETLSSRTYDNDVTNLLWRIFYVCDSSHFRFSLFSFSIFSSVLGLDLVLVFAFFSIFFLFSPLSYTPESLSRWARWAMGALNRYGDKKRSWRRKFARKGVVFCLSWHSLGVYFNYLPETFGYVLERWYDGNEWLWLCFFLIHSSISGFFFWLCTANSFQWFWFTGTGFGNRVYWWTFFFWTSPSIAIYNFVLMPYLIFMKFE